MSQASSGAATTNGDKMSAVTGGVWPATGQPLAVGLGGWARARVAARKAGEAWPAPGLELEKAVWRTAKQQAN